MIEIKGLREVCAHDMCASKACGEMIGCIAAMAWKDEKTGQVYVMHVMCAPPKLRKAYHEAGRNG